MLILQPGPWLKLLYKYVLVSMETDQQLSDSVHAKMALHLGHNSIFPPERI